MTGSRKKRLGELLIEAGVVDATQLQAALGHQRQWGVRLGQALVDLKLASEADIVQALARKFGYEVARLEALEPYGFEQAVKLVPREFALRNNVFPMAADTGSITVAMSDPTNLAVVDELRFRAGRRVKVCIGGDREVAGAVKSAYPNEFAVEAIALDLDVDDAGGEPVLDPFGGGSKDALEAFYGNGSSPFATDHVPGAPPVPGRPPAAAPPAGSAPAPVPQTRPAPPSAAAPPVANRRPAPAARGPAAPTSPGPEAKPRAAPVSPTAQSSRPSSPAATPLVDLELEGADLDEARAALLGAVPRGGFAGDEREAQEELTPIDEAVESIPGAQILATGPAPDVEIVEGRQPSPPLTTGELAILEAIDRLAGGAHAEPDVVKPTQAMAALIRLLIRRRIITEREFLDELQGK
jgi:hypothetical protein